MILPPVPQPASVILRVPSVASATPVEVSAGADPTLLAETVTTVLRGPSCSARPAAGVSVHRDYLFRSNA